MSQVAIEVAVAVARVCRPHGITDKDTDAEVETGCRMQDTQGARVGHTVLVAWDETRYCGRRARRGGKECVVLERGWS